MPPQVLRFGLELMRMFPVGLKIPLNVTGHVVIDN
jgi:hypothetical protein